jgi:hypothetical protein
MLGLYPMSAAQQQTNAGALPKARKSMLSAYVAAHKKLSSSPHLDTVWVRNLYSCVVYRHMVTIVADCVEIVGA